MVGIGDWGLGPIPNPQSPIPNPQSPKYALFKLIKIKFTYALNSKLNFKFLLSEISKIFIILVIIKNFTESEYLP
jgi:hypothetical protein